MTRAARAEGAPQGGALTLVKLLSRGFLSPRNQFCERTAEGRNASRNPRAR